MKADGIGLYVHIPFCVQKCRYCDFCSFSDAKSHGLIDDYVLALCNEIRSYKGREICVDTVFFGGGTPSLLAGNSFAKIMDTVKDSFKLSAEAEITLEANPKTVTAENLKKYIEYGVNRFSLGLQSIHENELKLLGRIHNYQDFLDTYNLIRSHGIDNINVDLMYGIPNQIKVSFEKTLTAVASLKPEHISVYGLILEKGTPLYNQKDSLNFPSEDCEADMYYMASNTLKPLGFKHYEISNYAMSGKECKHNLKYWRNLEYIGVGLAAHSYFDGKRFFNTSDLNEYINGAYPCSVTETDAESYAFEYVMMHLRLSDGFSLSEYQRIFGESFLSGREELVNRLSSLGYLSLSSDRISLTEKGFYISNWILTELL